MKKTKTEEALQEGQGAGADFLAACREIGRRHRQKQEHRFSKRRLDNHFDERLNVILKTAGWK